MTSLYTLALLLIGVIGTNLIKQFLPKIPEAFILIIVGIFLSITPIFRNFELEPEFFMLVIIAPLMFLDGQKQSFSKIKKRFSIIFLLSVVLAIATAIIVGLLANRVEVQWTLPLAVALAAIVVPTDAVAVKSMTASVDMPNGVGEALELESLFNDATGLVLLDLALSVLEQGKFSLILGIEHFLFVAVGGVIIGIITGFIIVGIRTNITFRTTSPETTIIPISLLTPFIVYFFAESFGTSGILAVVATGIVHNWESNKLRLTSTRVQLTSNTIWESISNILNSIVFIILGISLPIVWQEISHMGFIGFAQLIGLSILIYVAMYAVRYFWAFREDNQSANAFFDSHDNLKQHRFLSHVFAISGVHGTMTLAMAFSLPITIANHDFPYRAELIVVATLIILISMLMSAIILPVILPKKIESYTKKDLDTIRNKMVDYASLKVSETINDHTIRETITMQLQSQKGWFGDNRLDKENSSQHYNELLSNTKDVIINYIHSDVVQQNYSAEVIDTYEKIINRLKINNIFQRSPLQTIFHYIRSQYKHAKWHIQNGQITKKQRLQGRKKWAEEHHGKIQQWQNIHDGLLLLNNEVIDQVNTYLDDLLRESLQKNTADHQYISYVRQRFDRYFNLIKREYNKETPQIDSDLYIQAFQYEYNYIQQASTAGDIPNTLAAVLYNEINEAQTLELQQINQIEAIDS
ncbi:Na+/H+ antiporter [Leuconostoc litchii]|uniref:Sodium:proton antiporter n=1 Tax=Leuconostoc litchii TaxID=1981069 RepID=A0A6P2CPB7_9LACO|nr:sodium:proton antiporter [Leuconostoc litchii]TYC47424.1 sodium:proton antiporter [Leuconostoc litchii]GMA69440.1 Na+/H+ antiporter [Leuconostoc litchii]